MNALSTRSLSPFDKFINEPNNIENNKKDNQVKQNYY